MHKFVLLLLAVAGSSLSIPSSDSKLTIVNDKYYVSDIQLEFLQAYALCKVNHMTLATEIDVAETIELNNLLTSLKATNLYYLLGGFYQNGGWTYPKWIWLDSAAVMNYTNWYGDAPVSPQASCIVKTPLSSSTLNGKWTLASCTTKFYFICKNNTNN
ncbi:uncharacterized protein LOC126748638 [Anthonomus grandis grandis]|uniref:uncharacterized protein LOC126748638 n=1 Tax=Anthonomus grandis grandis TaxID=2921223 RepID=UPI0021654013|nr:uncharacterized protein LOC126748638 [Anthonomus grandis grandis]